MRVVGLFSSSQKQGLTLRSVAEYVRRESQFSAGMVSRNDPPTMKRSIPALMGRHLQRIVSVLADERSARMSQNSSALRPASLYETET
jgi:hypothetical protein